MIQETENKVKQVDSLLTTIKSVIKKHWGILIIIGVCFFVYWIWNLPEEEPTIDEQAPVYEASDSTMYSADSVDSVYYTEEDTTTTDEEEEE